MFFENGNVQISVSYLGPLPTSDEPEPSWLEPGLELNNFQLGSARLVTFSFQLGNFSIKARKSLKTKVEIVYVFSFVVHIFLLFSTRTNFTFITFNHPMILHCAMPME